MTSGSTQDLILDGAELSHPITIKRGKTTRTYQVIAYPTPITRKTTNMYADGTVTPDPKAIKKCRWYTAGIIRFHVNVETNSIYESRPDMHELEITLECLLDESHKQLLAKRAEEIYGLEFTSENFVICPFQTFIAQLAININGQMKTFYGTLSDNTELHPMRIIFNIKDKNELAEIAAKLDYPKDNDIILQYDYSLSGTSTARASLTVSAEELSRIDLEKQIFGSSKAQSMVVSRSFMDQVTGSIVAKLKVVEDIGVGGSSFGHDIIKQEIANAMSTTGFQKFNIEDLKKLEANDTEITDDLKANIITSTSASDANSSQSDKYTLDKESSSDSSDTLHEKNNETRRAGGQSSSSSNSESKKGGGKIGYGGFSLDLSGEKSTSSSHSASSNFDNADNSASTDHEKFSESSSQLKERDDKNASSNSTSRQVQGQIRLAKDIEASIIHRNQISKGFTISLERWHHQIATTSIKGRLLTKTDADILDESQIEKAKQEAIRQDCELTHKQIDDLLHEIDTLDEEKLQEMHEEFIELCPDGAMSKEIFTKKFQSQYPKGKASSFCRYAFDIFDKDKSGKLNFTEYVMAMHIHESDDLEHNLALAFDIFDYDKSGAIDQKEILHMITATSDLLGQTMDVTSAKNLARKIMDSCDKKRNKKITKEEFLDGCKSVKDYCRVVIPNFDNMMPFDENYEGDWQNGNKHGKGIYTWPDGRRYEGAWKDDKQNGKGVYTWPDGRRYEGEWKDDKQHGKGICTCSDGRKYEGDWKDGMKDGNGIEILSDGSRYEGQWVGDKKNGNGSWKSPAGDTYQGSFKDDLKNGKGTWVSANGDRYEGELKDDKKNGRGTWDSAGGEHYEGEFKDDKKNGKGTWNDEDGNTYKGDFKDDQMSGKGVLITASGDQYEGNFNDDEELEIGVWISSNGDRYEGELRNRKKHGKGVFTLADGDRYEGQFKDDQKTGKGILTSKDGSRYEGEYKNDVEHGKGTYTWDDGDQYVGDWQLGERTGKGVMKWTDGNKYDGEWKEGERCGHGILTSKDGSRFEGEWKNDKKNGKGRLTYANGGYIEGHYVDDNLQGYNMPVTKTYYRTYYTSN